MFKQDKVVKVKKLEQACIHQEKVIETMEKALKSKKFSVDDVSKALNEENQRLRAELQKLRVSNCCCICYFSHRLFSLVYTYNTSMAPSNSKHTRQISSKNSHFVTKVLQHLRRTLP